jgi:dihydroxyacetone kinase
MWNLRLVMGYVAKQDKVPRSSNLTRLFDNPAEFMDDMLAGFVDAHADKVCLVEGGVVRAKGSRPGKVAIIVGGGSGHYPAFAGLVGTGFADGAIVGNVFTSPSAHDAYSVGANASVGGGVILTAGNYAGDVMHFSEAAEQLTADGIPAAAFFTTDDIASAPTAESHQRRGIAGNLFIFKAMAAAAESGLNLQEVLRVSQKANEATRTLGVAFAGCTLPGGSAPLFEVPVGKMAIGLGIHGEPGIHEVETPSASQLAKILLEGLLPELKLESGDRVAAILNGLGSTKYEELFVVWKSISEALSKLGVTVVEPEVGEFVTSLDMAGCSLTLAKLDAELEAFWSAPCDAPAYRKGSTTGESFERNSKSVRSHHEEVLTFSEPTDVSKSTAVIINKCFEQMRDTVLAEEKYLGELDAIAGDGDHGRGMVKGLEAAAAASNAAVKSGCGTEEQLTLAGNAWAQKAGGTSGALWGAALKAVGQTLKNDLTEIDSKLVLASLRSGFSAVETLGKAKLGDKTMLDSLAPFIDSFEKQISLGVDISRAWSAATLDAKIAAEATSELSPRIGRARPLANKSIGTPDPGAISLVMCLEVVSKVLTEKKA